MLADLEVPSAPPARLTALFARAKFSHHDVRPRMKDEAIDALEAVRDALRACRARHATARAGSPSRTGAGRDVSTVVRRSSRSRSLPTIGLAIVLVVAPGRASSPFHVWLLVVLAVALLARSRRCGAPCPVGRRRSRLGRGGREPPAERFASLEKLERAVSMASTSGYDVHHRLRPVVREIAAGQLLVRRGIDLDRHPEAAHAVLGDDVWELVRPERPRPQARAAPGLGLEELEQVVAGLERI